MNKIQPGIILLIRVIIGITFIYASFDKILDPGKFARSITNYYIIPFGLENIIALIVPWLELLIGFGLVFGILIHGSIFISGGLFTFFILLILQAILRGFDIECGCGLKEGDMVGWSKIGENLLFLGGCIMIWYRNDSMFELFPNSLKTPLSD